MSPAHDIAGGPYYPVIKGPRKDVLCAYPIFDLIFLAFFIGMSLIVNNLLIAVAVSGTEELQSKSKLMQTKRRISYIEEQLANNLLFLRLKNLGFEISFSCLEPIFKSQDCILTECYSKGNYRVNICIL